jgi:hypothetical protein
MHPTKRDGAGVKRPPSSSARRLSLALGVALSLGVISATVTTPARAQVPASVSNQIGRADAALAQANQQVGNQQFGQATTSLGLVRAHVGKAHAAAIAQIGAPPTDPESDDPPGPPAVIAVLGLDHRVGMDVVPLFNGRTEPAVVNALQETLTVTYAARGQMLNRVIGLNPEGAGADYADDISDTLDTYKAEVQQLNSALAEYQLSESGRAALSNALTRVSATQAKVKRAFGAE